MPAILIDRRFIITGFLAFFLLTFIAFFRSESGVSSAIQGFIVAIVFFLAIPVSYTKAILGEPLANIGWRRGNMVSGVVAGAAAVVSGLAVTLLFIKLTPFHEGYVLPGIATESFFWFVLYEAALVSFVAFLYEVFFRGFIQTLWLRDAGVASVIVQAGLFALVVFLSGGFGWQRAPFVLFAPLAGAVAYSSGSIWYSFAASWLYLLLTDVLVLSLY